MVRVLPLLLALAASVGAWAQPADSLVAPRVGPDTLITDTVGALDPGAPPDTVDTARVPLVLPVPRAAAVEGGLDRPVRYTAVDSIRVTLAPRGTDPGDGPGDVVSLFGSVASEYEGATITAGRVDYETAREVLRASPIVSDSGEVGRPQYSGEEGEFTGRSFVYDLRSRRGRVTGAKTVIDDGYLLGGILKQKDAHVVFAQDAAYTTCELDHPHYAVEAGRMKIVDGERVYTGPVQLKLLGLPMPILLPFGYFPTADGRRSGPLPVKYGSDSSFGLFLDNVGWYWAVSDYLDAQVSGKIGTQGSVQARGQLRYNKRYAYSGNVSLSLARLRTGESTDPGFQPRTPAGLQWSHNQTLPAGQRVTASVNLQSAGLRLTSDDVGDQLAVSTTSNVSFSQTWPTVGRSLNVSLQAYQDFSTERTTAQLPNLQFSQQRRFPFRRGRDDHWYEKLSVSYSANAQNAFSFSPRTDSTRVEGISALDALFDVNALREAACPITEPDCDLTRFDYQVTQTVPIGASFSVPRFNLTFGPDVTFTETWTDEATTRTYVDSLGAAVSATERGFTAFRRLAATASASTELYGTFPIRVGALDGIRHTLTPRVSLQYEPDYAAFGYVREVQTNAAGETARYALNPSIPIDPSRTVAVSIQNAFVGRIVRTDSTGEETKETRQLLSLSLTGGYNFGSETSPFNPVNSSFTTNLFGVAASGSAAFNVYGLDSLGVQSPLTYFETSGRPLRLTNLNLRVGRSFQSSRRTGARDVRPVYNERLGDLYDATALTPGRAAIGYVDYAAPWSAAVDLTLNRSSFGVGEARTVATLSLQQVTAKLTPNWSLTGSSGLDLTSLEITTTRLGLRRDLHCWEMAINWQPIGVTKLFSVSLYVKSGFLRDFLRLDVPNSTVRTGGFGQQF